jgi:hypothetical protein
MAAPAPPPLDIHGYVQGIWSSTLVNPHGQVLSTNGAESLIVGLDWTLYKGQGWINSVNLGFFVAADWINGFQGAWVQSSPSVNGNFFDLIGGIVGSVTFAQYWTLREQFTMVISQDVCGIGSINCLAGGPGSGFAPLPANDLRLILNDKFTGWPITWNPYVAWFYDFANFGQQAVGTNGQVQGCFTCGPNRSEFFLGIDPTVSLSKWWGVPVTLKAPTYVTVGPANFWTGGAGNTIGTVRPTGVVVQNDGNWGVFTTGLQAIWDLGKWIPSNYGGWYAIGGFSWYDLINDNLVLSENESIGCDINRNESCRTSRSIWVGYVGLGVHF